MKNRRNYYRLLQVQPDAPTEVIHSSFRTLMKELRQHPDLGGSVAGAALLNEAHKVLCDPVQRARYDRELFSRYRKRSVSIASPREGTVAPSSCRFCNTPLEAGKPLGRRCLNCDTPLQPGKKESLERLSRRAVGRTKRNERILFRTQWPQTPLEGTMVDLSPTGMRFLCRARLEPGAVLKISGPDFEASAVVRNLGRELVNNAKLHAVGVAFLAVDFNKPRGSFLSTSA